MQRVWVTSDVEARLPEGWVEHCAPGGPTEYRPSVGDAAGVLQVSALPLEIVSTHADLGALATALGRGLAARGQDWGEPCGDRQGTCPLGRFGFAMFRGGEYPAMFVWITLGPGGALLWTWLGPNPVAEQAAQAVRIVLEARPADRARP